MELESFLACARGLLAIPSTVDRPEQLHRALEFVLDVVGPGFTVERFESRGKPSALVYLGASRPRFRVIFNAHLDVVPAPPEQFQPRLEGTQLYGRGAQDMKASALIQAMVFTSTSTSPPSCRTTARWPHSSPTCGLGVRIFPDDIWASDQRGCQGTAPASSS